MSKTEVAMSNCCRCGRRGISLGWLAFWGLVLFLVFATNSNKIQGLPDGSSQLSEVSDQQATAPMSVSCTPSKEQDKAMLRLLTEMEEEGRRLPKI